MADCQKPTGEQPKLQENYRRVALRAIAAAYAIKRPVHAPVLDDVIIGQTHAAGGFWTPTHDDDL
ncbi:hypothetical protein [Rhizobium jaguaris]|nr:hypothetical protein [Rhizobium jaguaris]